VRVCCCSSMRLRPKSSTSTSGRCLTCRFDVTSTSGASTRLARPTQSAIVDLRQFDARRRIGQVVGVLRHQHVGQQPGPAAINGAAQRLLYDAIAAAAAQFRWDLRVTLKLAGTCSRISITSSPRCCQRAAIGGTQFQLLNLSVGLLRLAARVRCRTGFDLALLGRCVSFDALESVSSVAGRYARAEKCC